MLEHCSPAPGPPKKKVSGEIIERTNGLTRAEGNWTKGSSASLVNPSSIHQVLQSGGIRLPGTGRADTSQFPALQICLCQASQSTLPSWPTSHLLVARDHIKEGAGCENIQCSQTTYIMGRGGQLSFSICQPVLRPDVQTHWWSIPKPYLTLKAPRENNVRI